MDFLSIINPDQGIEVFGQWIPRARLGLHLRLDKKSQEVEIAFGAGDTLRASQGLDAYFSLVGFNPEELTGFEQLHTYGRLVNLNVLQGAFAFQSQKSDPDGKLPAYHYSGRYIAWWVHKLASFYGWSRDAIFQLWPEEAAAYLQEILVQEIDDYERQRGLSELSYSYDKTSKKSRFIPTPRPSWMVSDPTEKVFRIRQDMMPVGEVIELDELYKKR